MKIPESILTDIGEMILKCIWNGKGMRKKQSNSGKKKEYDVGGLKLPNFRINHKLW